MQHDKYCLFLQVGMMSIVLFPNLRTICTEIDPSPTRPPSHHLDPKNLVYLICTSSSKMTSSSSSSLFPLIIKDIFCFHFLLLFFFPHFNPTKILIFREAFWAELSVQASWVAWIGPIAIITISNLVNREYNICHPKMAVDNSLVLRDISCLFCLWCWNVDRLVVRSCGRSHFCPQVGANTVLSCNTTTFMPYLISTQHNQTGFW